MIVIIEENGRSRSTVVCDYCGHEINDYGMGMACWEIDSTNHRYVPRFFHKVKCDPDINGGSSMLQTMELSHFLVYLCANVGLNLSDPKTVRHVVASAAAMAAIEI